MSDGLTDYCRSKERDLNRRLANEGSKGLYDKCKKLQQLSSKIDLDPVELSNCTNLTETLQGYVDKIKKVCDS